MAERRIGGPIIITVTRRYELIAGHYLPKVPEGHKCRGQHGHNYKLDFIVGRGSMVGARSTALDYRGFIADFDDLDAVIGPILAKLDHKNLNDIEGLENPTAENIAHWFIERVAFEWPVWLIGVRVWETDDCCATASLAAVI